MENNMFKISGNMVRDAVMYGAGDKSYCFMTVAVNRKNNGADFIPVKAFGTLAESIVKTLHKGNAVEIEGRINCSSYEKGKEKIFTTDLIADRVCLIERAAAVREVKQVEVVKTKGE